LCRLLNEQPPDWFPEGWSTVIRETVHSAWSRAAGENWGVLHPLRLKHLLFGDTPVLRSVFNSESIPFCGDADTICQGSVRPLKPIDYTDNIAGMRMAVDVGDWSKSRFVLAGGQSGNPLSPHYTDLFELWKNGDGVPMAWTPDEVRAAAKETLELVG
jgi:penicillin amidase